MKRLFYVVRLVFFFSWPVAAEEIVQQDDIAEIITEAESDLLNPCDGLKKDIRVVFDITRSVRLATVYEGGKVVRQYSIRGGRNGKERNPVAGTVCAFTTVGEMRPTALIKDKRSREHKNAKMPYYVELDASRGVGAHQGDLGGYSAACIRQGKADAKWLFDYVAENSRMHGQSVACSNIVFEIVDNTPGVAEARQACFASIKREDPVRSLTYLKPPVPQERPYRMGEMLPSDRFVPVIHEQLDFNVSQRLHRAAGQD